MRGLRSTLVMLIIAAGLGAYIYFVERHRDPVSEDEPSEQLFDFDAEAVTALEVTRSDGTTTQLRHEGDTWRVTSPIESEADESTASSIASSLASLEVRRVVAEGPVELEPFGLDEPVLDLGFTTAEDGSRRLLVGDQTPTGSDRYAKLSESDRVFLIASYLNGTFDKSTFDLRDKTILEFDRQELDGMEITQGDDVINFAQDGDDWRLAEPFEARADFATVESLLGSLSTGRMQSVASEGEDDLETFGLADPHLSVALSTGSSTATLHVGDESPEGGRYARDASRPLVFTIDSSLITSLERDAAEYRRKGLFEFRSFNATRIEIQHGDDIVALEKVEAADEEEDSWRRVQPVPGDVDQADVDEVLRLWSGLRVDAFVESRDDAGLGDENVVATVRARFGDDDTEEVVVFWQVGEDTFGIPEGEPGAGQIDSAAFDDAVEALGAVQLQE